MVEVEYDTRLSRPVRFRGRMSPSFRACMSTQAAMCRLGKQTPNEDKCICAYSGGLLKIYTQGCIEGVRDLDRGEYKSLKISFVARFFHNTLCYKFSPFPLMSHFSCSNAAHVGII